MAQIWRAQVSGGAAIWAAQNGSGTPAGVPTIVSVSPVSGTELAIAWTGTATHYRINSGAATVLTDGISPDTIGGLSPATPYSIQLRNGTGEWSIAVSGVTDNTGDGGGDISVELIAINSLHGHTAESPALTTGSVLAVADALHGHTADGVALTVIAVLVAADTLHGHTAESPTLTTGDVLAVADALHGHTADGTVLTVAAALAVADALHGHTAENVVLTAGDVFAIADALHAHRAGNVVLTLSDVALVIADALHAHRTDNIRFIGLLSTLSEIIPYLLNGLVDGRVWESATPDDLPRDAGKILPFVVWTIHGGSDSEYLEQTPAPSHSHARIQIHAAAPNGIVAERLMKDVRDALLASDYTVGVYGSQVGTYDPARKLKGRRQQFSLWFKQ